MTHGKPEQDGSDQASAFDVILVGGGLASCLTALRVSQQRPESRVLIVEASDRLVANKTWSFHESDITASQCAWISPLVQSQWPASKVRFPKYDRTLETPYCSIPSDHLRKTIEALPNIDVITNAEATDVSDTCVSLANGQKFSAPAVIDGRGYSPSQYISLGYQKFIGQEIVLTEPHGETLPTIMDASVSQLDGYRFVYLLPFDTHKILVEDTRYTDAEDLDEEHYRAGISRYVEERGWTMERIEREEMGVLPVVLAFDGPRFWDDRPIETPAIGLRAALFHSTTGYSFPDAVRVADLIADLPTITSASVLEAVRRYGLRQWREHRFFRLLNRMLFKAADPDKRYKVLERFYALPQPLIERFYAGRLRDTDKARILMGKPPVPISRALKVLSPNSVKSANKRNSYVGA